MRAKSCMKQLTFFGHIHPKRRRIVSASLVLLSFVSNGSTSAAPSSTSAADKIKTVNAAAHLQDEQAILKRARRNKEVFEDEQAINDYTEYLKLHPEDEHARAERAEEYRNEHRFDEYRRDLNILIRSKNVNTAIGAATDIGKLYQKEQKYGDAIKSFRLARSLGATELLTEISDCARLSGDYNTALQVSNDIIKKGEIFDGKKRRAQAYLAINKPTDALKDLNELVNSEMKNIKSIDKESRAIFPALKRLMLALTERAKCYDLLKDTKLAQQDRAEIRKIEQEAYNETPFLTK